MTLMLSVWVSTDAAPTVRRMRVDVTTAANDTNSNTETTPTTSPATYSLTWQWSRFNEDFGEVKPPPAATVTQSTP